MNEEFATLFNVIQKNVKKSLEGEVTLSSGDDLTLKSVAPYGIPSGLPQLDLYIGGKGGYPAGKIIEFYGRHMTGKSTAALHAMANWQKYGGGVAYIDTESSWDPKRAAVCGVNSSNVIVASCSTVEDVFDTIKEILNSLKNEGWDKPFLLVVDSTTAVPTQADIDNKLSDADRPGHEAKQIKRGVKQVNNLMADLEASIIFINHATAKFVQFGRKSDSSGGWSIKFFASLRIEFSSMGMLRDGDKQYGQKIKVNIEKIKGSALEYPTFNIELHHNTGFFSIGSLFDAMEATGFVTKAKGARNYTLLSGTSYECQIPTTKIVEWVNTHGGYDKLYASWRKWAIEQKYLDPWGSKKK